MSESNFFESQTPSSKIKANIISQYFPSYCRIIAKKHVPAKFRYIDLFAGPGIYEDGNPSTPILIARACHQDDFLKKRVHFMFNDKAHRDALRSHFTGEFPIGSFAYEPRFGDRTIGEDEAITKFLKKDFHVNGKNSAPSLLFIDPFGYKGIETKVLAQFMKNWGNEIFLFVNVKRIHPALENDKFDDLMQDLFPTTLSKVRQDRRYLNNAAERINLIIQCLGQEYQTILGGKVYYTAFKFKEEDNEATSHYILHFTKHHRGFDLVKQIYNDFANVGTVFDGINTYTFDAKKLEDKTVEMFDMYDMNIEQLKDELSKTFAGKELSAHDLFEKHHKDQLYTRAHYSAALRKLVVENKISVKYTDDKNHRVPVLISKDCLLKFD